MYEPKFEALGQKREVSRKKRDLDKLKKKLHGENKLKELCMRIECSGICGEMKYCPPSFVWFFVRPKNRPYKWW